MQGLSDTLPINGHLKGAEASALVLAHKTTNSDETKHPIFLASDSLWFNDKQMRFFSPVALFSSLFTCRCPLLAKKLGYKKANTGVKQAFCHEWETKVESVRKELTKAFLISSTANIV